MLLLLERGSIRAAISRNINRVLTQVVDHQSNPALGFEPGPIDYKSKKTHRSAPNWQSGLPFDLLAAFAGAIPHLGSYSMSPTAGLDLDV
jgi:hypothetical protein